MKKLVMILFLMALTLVNCGGNSGEATPEVAAKATDESEASTIVSAEDLAAYEAEELLPLETSLPDENSYIEELSQEQVSRATRESGEYIDPQMVMDLLRAEAGSAVSEPSLPNQPVTQQDKTWRISYDKLNSGKAYFDKGDYEQAAAAWQKIATDSPSYTLSVEIDCDPILLADSYRKLGALEMPVFILKAQINGRNCYRLCAGVFINENTARESVNEIVAVKEGAYPFPYLLR